MSVVKFARSAAASMIVVLGLGSAAQAGEMDIVDTAAGAGDFNTLVAAVKAAGLVETLKGDGPYTVFAPTDAAFAALPAGTVDDLLKPENKDKLIAILTYHVVPGKVMSGDLVGKQVWAETAGGSSVFVTGMSGNGVFVSSAPMNNKADMSQVVKADIATSNGVIHVVDRVILPN